VARLADRIREWDSRVQPLIAAEESGLAMGLVSQDPTSEARIQQTSKVAYAYACIMAHATAASSLPAVVQERQADRTWADVADHEFLDTWEQPNESQSSADLIELMVWSLFVAGDAFLALESFEDPEQRAIYFLQSPRMIVWPGETERVAKYVWRGYHGERVYLPEEICQVMMPNLQSNLRGFPPLAAAGYATNFNRLAHAWNDEMIRNRGAISWLLLVDGYVSQDSAESVALQFQKTHSSAGRRHSVAVIGSSGVGGVKDIKPMGLTPMDLNWIEGLKLSREEIVAALDCTPAEVGILEYANYANSQMQDKKFWQKNRRHMSRVARAITGQIVRPVWGPRYRLRFNYSGVEALQPDKKAEAERLRSLTGVPVMPPNEARRQLGLPDLQGDLAAFGDMVHVPISMVPATVGETAPSPTTQTGPTVVRSLFRRRLTKGRKRGLWLRQIAAREVPYRRMVVGVFNRIEKIVLGNLRKQNALNVNAVMFDVDAEAEHARQTARPLVEEFARDSGQEVIAELGLAADFAITHPAVQARVGVLTGRFADLVVRRQERELRILLTDGVDKGKTIADMAKDINAHFTLERSNAVRIARTEVVGASNAGALEGMVQSGVVSKKEWLNAGDDAVREEPFNHRVEEIVALDQPFVATGEPLEHPGDPGGSPGNIVNCRCTFLPIVGD